MPIEASQIGRSLPICPEPLGAGRPRVRPARNRKTANAIRRSACFRGTASRRTRTHLSDVHALIGTDPTRSAVKTTLRGAGSRRHVAKPPVAARNPGSYRDPSARRCAWGRPECSYALRALGRSPLGTANYGPSAGLWGSLGAALLNVRMDSLFLSSKGPLRGWKTGSLYQVIQHRYALTPGWMARLGISGQHESEPEGTTKTVDVPVRAMRRQTVWFFVLAPYILM